MNISLYVTLSLCRYSPTSFCYFIVYKFIFVHPCSPLLLLYLLSLYTKTYALILFTEGINKRFLNNIAGKKWNVKWKSLRGVPFINHTK